MSIAMSVSRKPKTDTQWTGNVYSRDSGDTYYGTMEMKGVNTLRVEACALGRFYCSGNNWTQDHRPGGTADQLAPDIAGAAVLTSRQSAKKFGQTGFIIRYKTFMPGRANARSYPSSARRGARQAARKMG